MDEIQNPEFQTDEPLSQTGLKSQISPSCPPSTPNISPTSSFSAPLSSVTSSIVTPPTSSPPTSSPPTSSPPLQKSTLPIPKFHVKIPIKQTMSILEIVETNCPTSWKKVFEAAKDELEDVNTILMTEEKTFGPFYPFKKDLFRAFQLTPLNKVKVVLVGQDPYHTEHSGQPIACGLSFSVAKNVPIPSSLKNMYKELIRTGFKAANHGDLSDWSLKGVLLLNSCLTVRPHQAGSHGQLWLGVIQRVVHAICDVNPNCVFILLGKQAQKLQKMLGDRVKVVAAGHPSGLNCRDPFVSSNTFVKVNEILVATKQDPIDWSLS